MMEPSRQETDPQPLTLLLADPQSLTREGLGRVLEEGNAFAVVAQAADGESAIGLVRRHAPDVAVLDLDLPEVSGVEATQQIRRHAPQTHVVILTGRSSTEDVCTSILAGARGYILRDEGIDEIAAGIRAAARGEAMLSPRATAALIDEYRRLADGHGVAAVESQKLTKRELEVLRLVTEGRDNREIATRLQISVSTVKSHVSKLLEELGVENRIQAAVEATRRHLV